MAYQPARPTAVYGDASAGLATGQPGERPQRWCGLSGSAGVVAACGVPATRIELVAPGQLPAQWEHWPRTVRDSFLQHRGPGQWYLILDGVATSNGYGIPSRPGKPGGSPRRSGHRCALTRWPRPGSTMTPASARTATRRTATGTGTCPRPATGTAFSGTARAWTRTGNGVKRGCCGLFDIKAVNGSLLADDERPAGRNTRGLGYRGQRYPIRATATVRPFSACSSIKG